MAVPNVNGRLHLTGVHQRPPASLICTIYMYKRAGSFCDPSIKPPNSPNGPTNM